MITVNITPEGEITISSESGGERAVMSKVYREQDGEGVSAETASDDLKADFFKQGWESATREAMLNFVNGRLVEYFQEIGMAGPLNEAGQDPHLNEPAGTGDENEYSFEDRLGDPEEWAQAWPGREEVVARTEDDDPTPVIAVVAQDPDIQPVTSSGEPEVEAQPVKTFENGVWTMSDEELQSRLDETYNRGRKDGELSPPPLTTTERTIQMMASEVNAKLWPEGYGNLSKRDVLAQFGIELAKRMGIEVSA